MKIEPKDVVAAYKAIRSVIEKSSIRAKEAFLLFFIRRISLICIFEGLVKNEDCNKSVDIFIKIISTFDNFTAEQCAIINKDSAESAGDSDEKAVEVGYFSILSYSFTFLSNNQNNYINYASDCYLGSIESYLIDHNDYELYNEITNIELLAQAVNILEASQDSEYLSQLWAWAGGAPIGKKLPEFSS